MRVAVVLCAVMAAASAASLLKKQPNLIFMFADDLGWAGVSWHNKNVTTPYLEKLMKDGIELDNSYVQPSCTPSRYAFMSGRYPYHGGMQHGVITPIQAECAPLDSKFISQALKDEGYATHLIGKWHLGFCDKACTPTYRGFDTFFGFYNGMINHFSHIFGFGDLSGHDLRNGTETVKYDDIHETDLELAEAQRLIKAAPKDKPFYLNMMWGAPHQPYVCDDKWADFYDDVKDKESKCYFAMITQLDDAIKQLVQTLKDEDQYDNTLIVFMADNGGEAPHALNTPLRGAKQSLFEGGMKSAGFVHSPLLKKKGYKADQLFHVTDIFPTFVALAGGDTKDLGLDGVDQSDFLINGGPSARTEIIHNIDDMPDPTQGVAAIRSGDYKLIEGHPGEVDGYEANLFKTYKHCHWDLPQYGGGAAPDKKRAASYILSAEEKAAEQKCMDESKNDYRLYNLKDDPYETKNLAAAEDHADKLSELKAKLKEARASTVYVPKSNELNLPSGHPKFWGNEWTPGWCQGIPQHNIPIEEAEHA